MKRIVIIIIALTVTFVATFAQGSLLKQTLDIAEVEVNDVTLSVFNMPENGQNHYYLCAGNLGFGDDFIQLQLDPVSELFIPLGDTLDDAQAKLEEFKALAKKPAGTGFETVGCLAIGNPSMAEQETVIVTSRRFLGQKLVEFSVRRNGYIRAAHIARGQIGSLASGVKFYRKLHPKEQ